MTPGMEATTDTRHDPASASECIAEKATDKARVEQAAPVDRPAPRDERTRLAIADQPIVGDWGIPIHG